MLTRDFSAPPWRRAFTIFGCSDPACQLKQKSEQWRQKFSPTKRNVGMLPQLRAALETRGMWSGGKVQELCDRLARSGWRP